MRIFPTYLIVLSLAAISVAEQPKQTAEQIQLQKASADQMPVSSAPAEFRTPLKTFEAYYSSVIGGPASKFRCLTPLAMKEWFGVDSLADEVVQRLRADNLLRDEKDHVLVEMRFTSNPTRPKILLRWSYNYKDPDGKRIPILEGQELTFVRTDLGWKIDLVETVEF